MSQPFLYYYRLDWQKRYSMLLFSYSINDPQWAKPKQQNEAQCVWKLAQLLISISCTLWFYTNNTGRTRDNFWSATKFSLMFVMHIHYSSSRESGSWTRYLNKLHLPLLVRIRWLYVSYSRENFSLLELIVDVEKSLTNMNASREKLLAKK